MPRRNRFDAPVKVDFSLSPGVAVSGAARSNELALDVFLTGLRDGQVMLCTYSRPPPPTWQDPLLKVVGPLDDIIAFVRAALT